MEQIDLALAIGERAKRIDDNLSVTAVAMDLIVCHRGVFPLRLQEMLTCPEGDLMHDIYGLRQHLNVLDAVMNDCFLPRLAA